jgi:glycosyltransferase involved in cell wall biosynthesis
MLTTSKRRILIFSLAYHPVVGGAEVAIKEITDRIPEAEFDMVTLRFDREHKSFERMGNVNVYRINSSKNLFPFKAFLFASQLHRDRRYKTVWAMMANWAGFAAVFFKMRYPHVRYVLSLQEGDPLPYIERKVRPVWPLFKKIFVKADTVQAISRYLSDWAKKMGHAGPVLVIPNGVDAEKFDGKPIEHKGVVLITTSRLVEKNGVGDVIESLMDLPHKVKFRIVGSGPLLPKLSARVKELMLEDRVEFVGFVDQRGIPKLLHEADIFIRPSLSEGMGNSFIEAMAAGLPVIATPVGGIPDFLVDPDRTPNRAPTGLYVEVRDPKGIARQVERLMGNPQLRETLIANGKRLAREKYDWDLIADEMKRKVFTV